MARLLQPSLSQTRLQELKSLNSNEKLELVKCFWPESSLTDIEFDHEEYDAFFAYIDQELASQRKLFSEFASAIELIQDLKKYSGRSQTELLGIVQHKYTKLDTTAILRSIELAVRLWLNLNIHSETVTPGPVYADTSSIEWPSAISLDDLIGGQFKSRRFSKSSIEPRIDIAFTASYLANICGITIHWTNNLADHLDINARKRVLKIYQHKICLLNHLKSTDPHIIPKSILEEAIDTLNLLFPFGDTQTKSFLARQNRPFYNLGLCGRERVLDLSRYPVWGMKLAELVDAFNEPPRDLLQAMRDRRNVMNWATFMIGILVLVLTIVSIAFGTVSTVYTIKQYNLGLAQACSAPGASIQLAKFCA